MDPELAWTHGVTPANDTSLGELAGSGSAVAAVAAFLSAEKTWKLEQEALAPTPPR